MAINICMTENRCSVESCEQTDIPRSNIIKQTSSEPCLMYCTVKKECLLNRSSFCSKYVKKSLVITHCSVRQTECQVNRGITELYIIIYTFPSVRNYSCMSPVQQAPSWAQYCCLDYQPWVFL